MLLGMVLDDLNGRISDGVRDDVTGKNERCKGWVFVPREFYELKTPFGHKNTYKVHTS